MIMLISNPSVYLCGRVFELWSLRGKPKGRYSGLPKPYVELVISLTGSHLWQANKTSVPLDFKDGWVTPVQSGPRFAETFGQLHLVGARLSIDTAANLFGSDINLDAESPIPLDSLIGYEASSLREQLLELETDSQRLKHLEQWIGNRITERPSLELPSLAVMAKMGWRTDALADLMGISSRGLRKKFKTKFGIGPKFWLQLNRFDAVLKSDIVEEGLSSTAAAFGYTDQSHMTSEFKRFAGLPPQAYLSTRKVEQAPDKAPHFLPSSH